jgi:hypothetical protein
MKRFKLSIALLSSGLMAYSPLLQAAAMTDAQKQAVNQILSGSTQGTFNDVYQRSGAFLDESSRGFIEAWLEKFGKTKFNPPQAQIVKDQNGKELVKVILSQLDQTMTITINPENTQEVDINGAKIPTQDLQSVPTVITALAEKNGALAPLAKELRTAKAPKAHKDTILTIEQFMALTPIERVHYTVLMRQFNEAGAKVLAAQNPQTQTSFILNPLMSVAPAFAEELRKIGDVCVVAGNLSVFEDGPYWKWKGESGGKVNGVHCSIAPKQRDQYQPPPNVNSLCEQVPHSGDLVACPVIGYKMNIKRGSDGQMHAYPICQDSARKGFSETATAECNNASPLHGEKDSPERLKDYEEILKGYALAKGGNWDKIKACFTDDHRVKAECAEMFQPHVDAFKAFKEKVDKTCVDTRKMPKDQTDACAEAKKRALDIYKYAANITAPPVTATPAPTSPADPDPACGIAGGELKDLGKGPVCVCPNGHPARRSAQTIMKYDKCNVPVEERSTMAKDKCEQKENKNSFSCNTGLYLGIGGALVAAWLLWPKSKNPQAPPTPCPSPFMLNGPPAGCPIPPWTPWKSEGNTGLTPSTGNVGGVRGTQPQSTGTH